MNALIKTTEKVSSNLHNNIKSIEKKVKLLKNKIEETVENDKSITVIITNSFTECRNRLRIKEYELSKEYFHLCEDDFEIHITPNNVTDLKYDDTYDEHFTITCRDSEVVLIF